ncbi:autoinducer binding domain-containing protein [Paraburkholderia bonniea]|uniref:autoinducer binding domain-containing protein n=1 Tax=Paraburkholderia bonniea TaxID=2152891 RepID=UPI0012913186|nr:autoinducer binding domain-containing protein [Paraburkholderia bonniea]
MALTPDHALHLHAVLALGACTDAETLRSQLFAVTRQLGFSAVLYAGRFALDGARVVARIESNYDHLWREHYEAKNYAAIDPTVDHALHSLAPLVWNDAMYRSPAQQQFREDAQAHGLVTGATFPVHSREGDAALLSLSVDGRGQLAKAHLNQHLMWGPFIATMVQDAMRKIVKGGALEQRPELTPRENEVLKWLASGKTSWDIAALLGISEHGVVHHVRNILVKFDVTTRRQAVAKAIALGMI